MKLIKLSLAAALIVTLAQAEEKLDLGISANMAMTSNYVWRGMTQSDDSPAIQGGFDVDYKGIYAGVWGSNINFDTKASMEFDAYVGYTNELFGIGYDLGYIQYAYPNDTKGSNFGEAYVGLSYDLEVVEISVTASFGVETDDFNADDNYEASVSVPLPMDISLDATVGNYVHSGVYYLVGVVKTFDKFDLSLAYTSMDYDDSQSDTEENIVVTISTSF